MFILLFPFWQQSTIKFSACLCYVRVHCELSSAFYGRRVWITFEMNDIIHMHYASIQLMQTVTVAFMQILLTAQLKNFLVRFARANNYTFSFIGCAFVCVWIMGGKMKRKEKNIVLSIRDWKLFFCSIRLLTHLIDNFAVWRRKQTKYEFEVDNGHKQSTVNDSLRRFSCQVVQWSRPN